MLYNLSKLDGESLEALRAFEAETGRTVLAMSPIPVGSDELDEAELARLQDLERRLDVVLVAVRERAPRPRRGRSS